MTFAMPMFKPWMPRAVRPWLYVVTVFCFQLSSGFYLGALEAVRGETGFMIEDLMMLLYAGLAGMAIYFPLLFRMKFRFTNQQLLIGAAIAMALCNLLTIQTREMSLLLPLCFIAGMAKIQGTFECMSNIQLWITPRRDFGVFFPVLHIVLLTAIEGSGWLCAHLAYHYHWHAMHYLSVGMMCFVIATQLCFCRPFCPMPGRLTLKGIDLLSGLLISGLMLMVSYIMVYGDYYMWFATPHIRLLAGLSLLLLAFILLRLRHHPAPYVSLKLFTRPWVWLILIVTAFAEIMLGCEHTLEEIFYTEVVQLEEHTKESLYLWALPGIYVGVVIDLLWLRWKRWKVWRLFALGFACIAVYATLMYVTIGTDVNIEQYRLAIATRGCAMAILAATLMWSLHEAIHDLELFFMGLFIFNIMHMYLAGACGFGIYSTLFGHHLADAISNNGAYLTPTAIDLTSFDLGTYVDQQYLPAMMTVAIKKIYGIVFYCSAAIAVVFAVAHIPAVRNGLRKVPLWSVYAIDYLARLRRK